MVEFLVTNEYKVKDPKADFREDGYNAGIDGFIPSSTPEFWKVFEEKNSSTKIDRKAGKIFIQPGEDVLIPSGLYTKLEPFSMLLDLNKSGIASKTKLDIGSCVIDKSYQGIIHYHLFNFSNKEQVVECDQKIVQMVQVPILTGMNVVHNQTPEEFFVEKTERGNRGFGSTGLT